MPSEPRELEPTVARARDAVLAGQAADAVPLLDARIAATSAPGAAADPDAWYWRGRARQAQQDPAGAEGDLRQAVALDPTWFAGRQQLADLLVSQRRCEEAVPLLLQQVESHPELAPAWTNLGFCRVRGEEPLVGLADLRKACSLGDARACEMVARAEARGAPAATP
ncbi:tetratricopeptide repeat protein [Myxococcota bacterium]|nr:tetratricopeptide repeat protein [Myxococcota bacterium]